MRRQLAWITLGVLLAALLAGEVLWRVGAWPARAYPPPSIAVTYGAALGHLALAKRRFGDPTPLAPMSIEAIMSLPAFPGYPGLPHLHEISALEARGVTVTGFVARVRKMRDGDYKLQLTAAPPGRCLTYNAPDQLITELPPGVRARKPGYTWERIEALCGTAAPIRVSGWLMYDFPKVGELYRSTPWEVHPITRIEACCWRELS